MRNEYTGTIGTCRVVQLRELMDSAYGHAALCQPLNVLLSAGLGPSTGVINEHELLKSGIGEILSRHTQWQMRDLLRGGAGICMRLTVMT